MDIIETYSPPAHTGKWSKVIPFFREFVYRLRDINIAFWGLVFALPIFGVIAVLIKRDSPGPIFYQGERAAKGGGSFKMIKFRTMFEDDTSYQGPKVTGNGDPRVTPIGRWLRETKLNELPQLWNVLVGDMSFVGPRPEDPEIAAGWPEEVRQEILSVRPGITSPASVLYRDEESLLSPDKVMDQYLNLVQPSKLRLDQLYVRHRSILLDLDVFLWTFWVLLPRLGSFKPPETSLFFGPVAKIGKRYANWLVIDFLISFLAFGISGVFWRSLGPIDLGLFFAIFLSLAFSLLFSLIGAIVGIQKTVWSTASASEIFDLGLTTVLASLLSLLINHNQIMPFQIIILASLLAFLGFVVVRYRQRLLAGVARRVLNLQRVANKFREKVLIVGSGKAGEFATWMLHNGPHASRYQVVGYVDDDILKYDVKLRGVKVLGQCIDIPEIVHQEDIGLILFAIHNINPLERDKILRLCGDTQAQVVIVPDVMGAIDKAVADNMPKHAKTQPVPLETQSSQVTPGYLADWLAELKTELENGDTARGLERIEALRSQVAGPAVHE